MAPAFLSISTSLALSFCYALLVSSLQYNLSSINDSSLSYLPVSDPEVLDPCLLYVLSKSSYIDLPDGGARMFYYFFETFSENSPVMLWLTGVPGLTCNIALFRENGPFRIKHDLSLEPNEYSWDKEMNMIYVDEPRGTGFSYINSNSDTHNHDGIDDLYNFLLIFFEKHHAFRDNQFYITGQTYAGKYAPALANRIHKENNINPSSRINLKGVAIGNGFTYPSKQLGTTLEYSEQINNLISNEDRAAIATLSEACISTADSCDVHLDQHNCEAAYDSCGSLIQEIAKSKGKNVYDIKKPYFAGELNYDFSNVHALLNQEPVRSHLNGVESLELFNRKINEAMKGYYMKNAENEILSLLNQGTDLLIYAGENDMLCSAYGNLKWVKELNWEENTNMINKEIEYLVFILNGALAGKWRLYKHFAFLELKNAGHMVGMDQPEVAFEMIKKWIQYVNGHRFD